MPPDQANWTPEMAEQFDGDVDAVFDRALEAAANWPDDQTPFYTILTKMFGGRQEAGRRTHMVCPTGLIEPGVYEWVEIESSAKEYHQLPFPGALLEQPLKAIQALNVIRSTKNLWQMRKMEKLKQDAAKGRTS